jgi:Protein of unknown function (DUF3445)
MSDVVLMDGTYRQKIQMRRQLISTQEDHVVGFHPVAADAVTELYLYLFEDISPPPISNHVPAGRRLPA